MKNLFALVALVIALGLVVTPALADGVRLTGKVMAIHPEEQLFTIESEGKQIKLRLGPGATEELRAQYGQLRMGDTIRVETDDEDLIAMSIKILPASVLPEPSAEPEPGEPQAETMGKDY